MSMLKNQSFGWDIIRPGWAKRSHSISEEMTNPTSSPLSTKAVLTTRRKVWSPTHWTVLKKSFGSRASDQSRVQTNQVPHSGYIWTTLGNNSLTWRSEGCKANRWKHSRMQNNGSGPRWQLDSLMKSWPSRFKIPRMKDSDGLGNQQNQWA